MRRHFGLRLPHAWLTSAKNSSGLPLPSLPAAVRAPLTVSRLPEAAFAADIVPGPPGTGLEHRVDALAPFQSFLRSFLPSTSNASQAVRNDSAVFLLSPIPTTIFASLRRILASPAKSESPDTMKKNVNLGGASELCRHCGKGNVRGVLAGRERGVPEPFERR